ncbi:hypothetical protein MMC22_004003 [Lobaria immixta]|nr:hypothetical protein [Lobaria immixta]
MHSTTFGPDYGQDPIAIVGLACRLPGNSNSPTAFWDFLINGGCAEIEPPRSRFNLKGHFDGSMKSGTMRSPGGMFLENIDPKDIDARFFSLSNADAISMDPQQRQLLEVVYEGLENAGISLGMLRSQSYGCFVGSYSSDYSDMQARDPEDRSPSWTVGSGRAMLSNRISHFLDIKGPSMTIDTACSGSLISLDLACRYLHTRDADGAIVAGCNLYMSPEHNMDMSAARASSSSTGRCHTFDAKADGYIKAEAVNMVVLKRLDDAVRDKDPIRAIVRGSSTNSDGWTVGIASPSPEAQAVAIRRAYVRAGIADIQGTSYIECHGTGTQAGDPMEVSGVASVFSESRTADHPLIIGSVKSNVGHSEPAAGITGLIKTILALENGIIPGNPTFETPNPKIDFHKLKVHVSKTTIPWPDVPFRRAGVNSFGFGGSNAHAVIDEPGGFIDKYNAHHVSSYASDIDELFADEIIGRPSLLLFSANDELSLKSYFKAIRKHLINPRVNVKIIDLAYTLSERRTHHFHRGCVVARNLDFDEGSFNSGKIHNTVPRIGFVFTGQGAQWSQMAKSLVETLPVAGILIKHLDDVLQSLPDPPKWSLLAELVEPRSPEHLRLPVFSQPLVTALQLAIVAVLTDWGICPQNVVGHSSGEIAAAATAGYITPEEAIKIAYLRGRAALDCQDETGTEFGMLAIGLGHCDAENYLMNASEVIQIACINSPNSITVSGKVTDLQTLEARVQADRHFARLLQVDLPYHSGHMTGIAAHYKELLIRCERLFAPGVRGGDIIMFSSVTGQQMTGECDSSYWQTNMVSPVLFQSAFEQMIKEGNVDFVVEIGPAGALSGPIAQIRKGLGAKGVALKYFSSSLRGPDAVNAVFDVAGQVFMSGGSVNMSKVNGYEETSGKPFLIVDLPNYQWNHSIKYWHESDSSKDWRFRQFPNHDLLGSKVMGTSWHAPSWKKTLRLSDNPWLQDHQISEDIIFPAAGYMAMAIEALYQMGRSLGRINEIDDIDKVSYRLRNVSFLKAMVLEKEKDHKMFLTLAPCIGPQDSWHEFKVSSISEGAWAEHCRGLICLLQGGLTIAPKKYLEPFKYGTSAQPWYKALGDVGYTFGPHFQKQIQVESVAGQRYSRVLLSFSDPQSPNTQSSYPMHPVCMDGCLQSGVPSLWQGNRSSMDTALVPAIIDDLVVYSRPTSLKTGIAVSTSEHTGNGRIDEAKRYKTHVSVYDTDSGFLIFQMSGLHYSKLETHKDRHGPHEYTRLSWKPDISLLTDIQPQSVNFEQEKSTTALSGSSSSILVDHVIDMVAHKKPDLAVMEIDMVASAHSTWLEPNTYDRVYRSACRRYLFTSTSPTSLLEVQEKYQQYVFAEFDICDIMKPNQDLLSQGKQFELIIVKLPPTSADNVKNAIENTKDLLHRGGYLLLILKGSDSQYEIPAKDFWSAQTLVDVLHANGFEEPITVPSTFHASISAFLCANSIDQKGSSACKPPVSIISFSTPVSSNDTIKHSLIKFGWRVTTHHYTTLDISDDSYVLVLDDMTSPVLPTISDGQWKALQYLINSGHRILWVTVGSQFEVSHPQNALFNGLARSLRAEDPDLVLKILDVESGSGHETPGAINKILLSFQTATLHDIFETEYCERRGILYTSRILLDHGLNQAECDDSLGAVLQVKPFHGNSSCVRMQCERTGDLRSLHFSEVSTTEVFLQDGFVEVEIYAAGLNYKDVATALGYIPENQHLLGQEGAGVVRRVSESASSYKVGDRVLVDCRGCFANRVQAPIEGLHHLPDSMSFEEAATYCIVYLTSIYALLDLANLQRDQSVLIHSAAGGVGIAAIQISKHIGAEIYVTAGSEEKRQFLTKNFDISADHIFSSRNGDFAPKLKNMTDGRGVNVILNSLTGNLLDESWRCIADGGIMVEIGKRDILDRNTLPMEPFGRNASYRALDLSHSSVTRDTFARLISRMFDLIANGRIKPIAPMKIYSFSEIVDAMRYMRGGSHIGKIVISDGHERDIEVPTRAARSVLKLRGDVSYLMVGGLKGICGSLATYLAQHGAKHITVLSRSGYQDEKSQAVLQDLSAIGAQVDLVKGDVSNIDDVQRVFLQSTRRVAGIIQGAMVLRDKTFPSMTVEDFHETICSKVQGTWNLHSTAVQLSLNLNFFTMLSSVSGVIGHKGQANYAAANVFLDSFAAYRHNLGLAACSVDLGIIEDVGYLNQRQDIAGRMDKKSWEGINEGLLHKIVKFSILQQTSMMGKAAQIIIGIPAPLQEDSELLSDARFRGLCFSNGKGQSNTTTNDHDSSRAAVQAFSAMLKAKSDHSALIAAAAELVNHQFTKILGLSEPVEPGKPLAVYGMDSLAAVDLRNWIRTQLGAEITTLEILNVTSLLALCEKLLTKLTQR